MPKSDTCPGDVAVETLGGMDSAGSCDSVSDVSLEQLSAEERECILFLEETLEALETDEDSDLPGDTPDLQLRPGTVAEKIAHLSASLSGAISKSVHDGPKGEGRREQKSVPGFLVPTPLVMAKSSQPNAEAGMGCPANVSRKIGSSPGQDTTAAPWKGGHQDRPKAGSSRGPLSNQGLMELRLKLPLKKHAQSFSSGERAKPSPADRSERPADSPSQHAPLHQTPKPKAAPPMVAPKPKRLPPSIAVAAHKAAVPNPEPRTNCLGTSPREGGFMDPQRVRREALAKLGLLQDGGPAPSLGARTLPPAMTRPRSRSDLPLVSPSARPPQPGGGRSATLERLGVSLDCCSGSKGRLRTRTTSLRDRKELEATQLDTTGAKPPSYTPLFPNGISAAMVPWNQPGQVRQEALRKLGLLRE